MKSVLIKSDPQNLLKLAIEKGAGLEQLEKLMDLQERWEKKEARKMYFHAYAEFQSLKPIIKKDKKVSFTSKKTQMKTEYSFAKLQQIQKQIDPILSKLGLSYSFKSKEENNKLTILCVASHESGHQETTQMSAPMDVSGNKNPIQSIGSTNTYLMRYTLCNAFGISADEDNDGQTALKKPLPPVSEKDIDALKEKLILITTNKELSKLWSDNPKLQSTEVVNRMFTAKKTELEEIKVLLSLYNEIDENKIPVEESLNISRIIDKKEVLSYQKVITYLKNIKNG